MIPWFETPITYDVRAKPRNVASLTGTKGTSVSSPLHATTLLTSIRSSDG
jgi:hypothetical protein